MPNGDPGIPFDRYMGALTIDDVFRSVILATLKSSNNRALRTAYDQILVRSTTWTTTRTLLLRTSKPSVLANLGVPRSAISPRRHPVRYAAHLAGQNREVQQVQASRR